MTGSAVTGAVGEEVTPPADQPDGTGDTHAAVLLAQLVDLAHNQRRLELDARRIGLDIQRLDATVQLMGTSVTSLSSEMRQLGTYVQRMETKLDLHAQRLNTHLRTIMEHIGVPLSETMLSTRSEDA